MQGKFAHATSVLHQRLLNELFPSGVQIIDSELAEGALADILENPNGPVVTLNTGIRKGLKRQVSQKLKEIRWLPSVDEGNFVAVVNSANFCECLFFAHLVAAAELRKQGRCPEAVEPQPGGALQDGAGAVLQNHVEEVGGDAPANDEDSVSYDGLSAGAEHHSTVHVEAEGGVGADCTLLGGLSTAVDCLDNLHASGQAAEDGPGGMQSVHLQDQEQVGLMEEVAIAAGGGPLTEIQQQLLSPMSGLAAACAIIEDACVEGRPRRAKAGIAKPWFEARQSAQGEEGNQRPAKRPKASQGAGRVKRRRSKRSGK